MGKKGDLEEKKWNLRWKEEHWKRVVAEKRECCGEEEEFDLQDTFTTPKSKFDGVRGTGNGTTRATGATRVCD